VALFCAKTACSGVLFRWLPANAPIASITPFCLHPGGDGRGTGHLRCVGRSSRTPASASAVGSGLLPRASPGPETMIDNPSPTGHVVPADVELSACVLLPVTSACRCEGINH